MNPIVLRHLIIGLLILTGIFHLAVALLNAAPGLGLPLTIFGVIYIALSFYVRKDSHKKTKRKKAKVNGRTAIVATMVFCMIGLALGSVGYVQNGAPAALPLMLLIDIAIIAAGAMWLRKAHAK